MGIAADTYARITREMYNDWLTRFYPRQKVLMDTVQTGALLDAQLARTGETTQGALRAAQTGEANRLARYGLSSSPDTDREGKLALSGVAARNGLRDHARARSLRILSGAGQGIHDRVRPY